MTDKAATKEEWMERYAAEMQSQADFGDSAARDAAQAGWEAAVFFNDGDEEAALADLTPEDAVAEEMSCWTD